MITINYNKCKQQLPREAEPGAAHGAGADSRSGMLEKSIGKKVSLIGAAMPGELNVRLDAVSYALLRLHRDEQASAWMDRIMAQYRAGKFPCGFVGNLPPASDDAGHGDDLPLLGGDGKLVVF